MRAEVKVFETLMVKLQAIQQKLRELHSQKKKNYSHGDRTDAQLHRQIGRGSVSQR